MTTDAQIKAMTREQLADFIYHESLSLGAYDLDIDSDMAKIAEAVIKENEKKKQAQIDALKRKTYIQGLVSSIGESHQFDVSNVDIEAQNTVAWNRARQCTPITGTLWIYGPQGTGKTWLAHCVLNEYLSRYRTAAEVDAVQMKHWDWGDIKSRIKPYVQANILLIDDIDKPQWTSCGLDCLKMIFDYRYEYKRATIITANTGASACRDMMIQARPDNPSVVASIFDRMKPLEPLKLIGGSNR